MEDLSYLHTEYARNAMIEEYNGVDRWHMQPEILGGIEDNIKWADEALHNFRYPNEQRLQRALSYIDQIREIIKAQLERDE